MLPATRKLLRTHDPISALANCHVVGIDSFVFRGRHTAEEGMIRVFAVRPYCHVLEKVFGDDEDFVVMLHNHRQDIVLTRLCGNPVNVVPVLAEAQGNEEQGRLLHRYRFGSALKGGDFTLVPNGTVAVLGYERHSLTAAGELGLFMPSFTFHTMTAHPGSAWCVEEGNLADEDTTHCYSTRANKQLDAKMLYVPLDHRQMLGLWESVRERAVKEGTL